jgi:hypothetical protein
MTKNDQDIGALLREDYVVPQSFFDKTRTKTSHFMLNTLFTNGSLTNTEFFVNAFIGDHGFSNRFVRPLFLLFKITPNDSKWNTIAPRLRAKNEYLMEYFVGVQDKKHLVMMVFQVPDRFSKEYVHFKNGKYSQFSIEYKKLFNRYTNNERAQPVESIIWKVLYKTADLRKDMEAFFTVDPKDTHPVKFDPEDELWGIPEDKWEIYRYLNQESKDE